MKDEFKELVQSKLPTRFLGAQPVGFRRCLNHDAIEVEIAGMPEPLRIAHREVRFMVTSLPCLDGK